MQRTGRAVEGVLVLRCDRSRPEDARLPLGARDRPYAVRAEPSLHGRCERAHLPVEIAIGPERLVGFGLSGLAVRRPDRLQSRKRPLRQRWNRNGVSTALFFHAPAISVLGQALSLCNSAHVVGERVRHDFSARPLRSCGSASQEPCSALEFAKRRWLGGNAASGAQRSVARDQLVEAFFARLGSR